MTESQAFEAHLGSCTACQELLTQAETDLAPLAAWEPDPPSQEAWTRVGNRIREELQQPQVVITPPVVPRSWNMPAMFAMAAAILFLLGIGFLISNQQPGQRAEDPMAVGKMEKPKANGGETHRPENRRPHHKRAHAPAEVVDLEEGEGYEVTQQVVEKDLLCVIIQEKKS